MAATKRLATAQEWEEHREEIVKLYIEKNWPLRLVMAKLAKKGFEPTASQYRSRFKIWRLKKLRKPRETPKGEVTAQPTASESGDMRDEFWKFEIDDLAFGVMLEDIEKNLGADFSTLS